MLFQDLTFTLNRGDKMVVVGPNGIGKTSLLRLLAGVDEPDAGQVTRRRGGTAGYLPQDPSFPPECTVLDAVLQSDSSIANAVLQYEVALQHPENKAALEQAYDRMHALNGWQLQSEARSILSSLGIEDLSRKMKGLSGGQRRRVALAASLLAKPDLLVLDEPTNHLDLGAITWLETQLKHSDMTLLMVTHDRTFMESVCTGIVEMDQKSTHLHPFGGPGSWDRYKELREERRQAQAKAAADAKTQLIKETEWMRRQPKARSTKAKLCTAMQGKKVLIMEDACCSSGGEPVIDGFEYDFLPRERVGIVGPNGAGKTSLIEMIAGLRPLTHGSRDIGETTNIGYFTQHVDDIPQNMTVINYIRCVKSLSGGERRRLQLAAVLAGQPSFLILDEPTVTFIDGDFASANVHRGLIDLSCVDSLEGVLRNYAGCLLVVSHDRSFMDAVADKLFVVEGDGPVRMFDGQFSEYLDLLGDMEKFGGQAQRDSSAQRRPAPEDQAATLNSESQPQAQSEASGGLITAASSNGKLKLGFRCADTCKPPSSCLSWPREGQTLTCRLYLSRKANITRWLDCREREEFEGLEAVIERLSAKQKLLEDKLAGSYDEETSQALAKVAVEVDTKTDRWLELAERADV
eukprot:jgi/Astpho2/1478/fgenesh1_pm.00026_%23_6_t